MIRNIVALSALGGCEFRRVNAIEPDTDSNRKPLEYQPKDRYNNRKRLSLNRHGRGPFCRFSVKGLPASAGIYAVTVAECLVYVGIAQNLKERWSPGGYGNIQPRNCFQGGQSTNCKVNHAILMAAREGRAIHLWIHETVSPRPLEKEMIRMFDPPWNDQG